MDDGGRYDANDGPERGFECCQMGLQSAPTAIAIARTIKKMQHSRHAGRGWGGTSSLEAVQNCTDRLVFLFVAFQMIWNGESSSTTIVT